MSGIITVMMGGNEILPINEQNLGILRWFIPIVFEIYN